VPGGAIGVRLKLKVPKMSSWAERFGLMWAEQRRLSVMSAWGRRRSHRWRGEIRVGAA
jgi:hypothetical protein